MKIEVYVDKTDIEAGERRDPRNCPAARAITRALREQTPYQEAIVYDYIYVVLNGAATLRADLPISLAYFVERFDNVFPVSPLRFCIEFEETTHYGRPFVMENKTDGNDGASRASDGTKNVPAVHPMQSNTACGDWLESKRGKPTELQEQDILYACGK